MRNLQSLRLLLAERDKEIERLNKCIKDDKENADEIIVEQQKEIERLNNIINEALGIANERVNYYHHINNKEQLEDWEDIFDALVKRDSDKE